MSPEQASEASALRPDPGEVTRALRDWHAGDEDAPARLLPLVYGDLRRVARALARGERRNHTLQPTAVVHEAWIQLVGSGVQSPEAEWQSREHFLAIAARAMRRVLVDYARRRNRIKRGAGIEQVPLLEDTDAPSAEAEGSLNLHLAVHHALDRLESFAPQEARVVELRVFGGLTLDESADCLGVSRRTAVRLWRRARAWLEAELEGVRTLDA